MRYFFSILLFVVLFAVFARAADEHKPVKMEGMTHESSMQGDSHEGMTPDMHEHSEHDSMSHDGHEASQDAAEHDHQKMMEEVREADIPVGIDEKLGNVLTDAMFTDSEGNMVNLLAMTDVPVMLLPIYYRCPDVCNMLQGSFAEILPDVALKPGTEIKIISLSFDPRETPKDAARAKRNYIAQLDGKFPAEYWKFLVGDEHAIKTVLDAIGYTVQKQGGLWAHPVAAVAIAPGGKVVRYLYGTTFLPFDITMAGTEAAQGKTGLSVKRLLSYCYNYDPEGRRYVFDILRVSGFSILGFVGIFLAWLFLGGKKRR